MRRKITNTEHTIPPIAQNIPHFNKDIDKQDMAANAPNKTAKKVNVFPKLILIEHKTMALFSNERMKLEKDYSQV